MSFSSRRSVLAGTGALVFSFCSQSRLAAQEAAQGGQQSGAARALPGSLKTSPFLDSWIRIDANGSISVLTGKAELGQGIKTALLQVAAEELDIALPSLTIITADTARTANEGYTSGSHSMQDSGTAIQNAAAQVRALLIAQAASRFALRRRISLTTENGSVLAPDGRRLSYGDLVAAGDASRSGAT